MKKLLTIIRNWEAYKSWKAIRRGEKPVNMKRGVGYYFPTGLLFVKNIGRIDEIKMQSGRTAIAELIDYTLFRDPDDMIKSSLWHMSGYKGEKPFREMTFEEYLKSAFSR